MTRSIKLVLATVLSSAALIAFFFVALPIGLNYYDSVTKKKLLDVAGEELPPRASMGKMEEFMRRHTTRFAFDDQYHHQFIGFIPQTELDRFLFDRKVQLVLNVTEDQVFKSAGVQVFYTAL